MKKPAKTLRTRNLDAAKLEQAQGGRGICHGYYECMFCHMTTSYYWDNCPGCGKFFEWQPKGGAKGGAIP